MNDKKTDWNNYYESSFWAAKFTRAYTASQLMRLLRTHLDDHGSKRILELGGANSCFIEKILRGMDVSEYHVVDSNLKGLELLGNRFRGDQRIYLHYRDIMEVAEPLLIADIVFSVGLVEHFSEFDTAQVVRAHVDHLKENGLLIISYPTPTPLYRMARLGTELLDRWPFPDERPLAFSEIERALPEMTPLERKVLWPLIYTQEMVAFKKARSTY
jgi:cyclopropane fatty-acyl-phospholipid synthase-like methyltransferase